MKRPIVLVGLRCVGKTTVGRALAQELELAFVDLDEELAAREGSGRAAGELLAELGEPEFREFEARALLECLSRGVLVLATGGGVVEREENRTLIHERARVVWLDAADEVLLERRAADGTSRPLLEGEDPREELSKLGPRRRPLYEALSGGAAVACEADISSIVRDLAEGLRNELSAGD